MLRFRIGNKPRSIKRPEGRCSGGPEARINKMRKIVTALVRHERIEGRLHYIDEARGYAERLIQVAAKYGDQHKATMELADYWLLDKDLVPKLFKVLVPRYSSLNGTITQVYRLPNTNGKGNLCLELKGNPLPPVVFKTRNVEGSLINVLLSEAKKEYRMAKYKEMAKNFNSPENDFRTKELPNTAPLSENETTSVTPPVP